MTGNVKLCCMVLPSLGFVLRGREFQRLSCPVAFGKTDLCVLSSGLLSRAPRFRGEVVCPVVKDLVCLSELPLIPMLRQYEQSDVAVVFKSNRKFLLFKFVRRLSWFLRPSWLPW